MFSLQGKTALITGAASGIGEATARALAAAGARVWLADRDERGQEVARELCQQGHGAEFTLLDVTDEARCADVAGEVAGESGRLDILVNNAGVGHVGTILETSGADLERMLAVNVRGVFNVSKAFLPAIIAQGGGVILNMASIGGVIGVRDRLAYCTSKFAVVGLTKSMALDHAPQGVRVNCLCPGRVETPFVQARLREYPDPAAAHAEMSATQALGRMATPDEIAAAALYLASDEAAFITGSAFIIDGGWSAGK